MLTASVSSLEDLLEESYYQPKQSPDFPHQLYPTVVDIPESEKVPYKRDIANRYLRQIFWYAPLAYGYARCFHGVSAVSDEQVVQMFQRSCFGKFLTSTFTAADRKNFAKELADANEQDYLKADLSQMGEVVPNEGFYTASVVVLFRRSGQSLTLTAIQLNAQTLRPQDGDRFELAKHSTLLGCCYYTVALEHPKVHFPLDTINGLTKRLLPQGHWLLQLLRPHFDYSLSVNYAVLHSPRSIVQNDQKFIHTPLQTEKKEFLGKLMAAGYAGIEGHPNYQPYTFTLTPRPLQTDYGVFLQAYYDCILDFTHRLVAHSPIDQPIEVWADSIAGYLAGFPDGKSIRQADILAKTLAKIIWQSSVEHACDHYSFSQLPVRQLCYRIRIQPDQPADFRLDRKALRTVDDLFRHKMAWRMFYKPNNVTLLQDTDYGFQDPALRELNRAFLMQLRRTEATLKAKGIFVYTPLRQISRSIQY